MVTIRAGLVGGALIAASAMTQGTAAASSVHDLRMGHPAALSSVAPARIRFLDRAGHSISRVSARSSIRFELTFTSPRSFPSGYTDVRFEVSSAGSLKRVLIYGTPIHLLPGHSLRVTIPVSLSRSWIGRWQVSGMITLLKRPGGMPLGYAGRAAARLTVVR